MVGAPSSRRGDDHSRLDASRRSSGSIKCVGGSLHHAGGILRCRSAGAISRSLGEGFCDDGGNKNPSIESMRPTLRAYSAPHFLYSALFPPKHRGRGPGSKETAASSNIHPTSAGPTCSWERALSSDGRRRGNQGESLSEAGEVAEACCCQRHRRGGYLHRYMGFEQETVSCPPVAELRVIGGLGEFPRRRGKSRDAGGVRGQARSENSNNGNKGAAACTAFAREHARGGAETYRQESAEQVESVRSERGKAGAESSIVACRLPGETPPNSLLVEHPSWQTSAEEGEQQHPEQEERDARTVRAPSYPLELFAEGSRVAPPRSPPRPLAEDEMVAVTTPAWWRSGRSGRSGSGNSANNTSFNRPKGAKRQKAWGVSAQRKKSASTPSAAAPGRKTTMTTAATDARNHFGRNRTKEGGARKFRAAADARPSPQSTVKHCSSAFLPYSLERPVSPERSRAFFYTSN